MGIIIIYSIRKKKKKSDLDLFQNWSINISWKGLIILL